MLLQEGMFLCAGYATRMRPLTNEIPKVLLELGQKNIFTWTMQYLASQNIKRVSVNLHHGAKFVHDFLAQERFEQEIHTFDEEAILGSGGGVKNMQGFVTGEHFLVMNCDIVTDLDLQKMYDFHVEKNALATLYIAPDPNKKYTPIYMNSDQKINSILQPNTKQTYAGMFGGISIFSKDIFRHMPLSQSFCLVKDLLEPLCQQGENIYAYQDNASWFDTGEIPLYQSTIEAISKHPLGWMKTT